MAVRPPAEVELTAGLVRALLAEQHPDLAHLPVELVAQGWDNGTFRLGDDLAVRLPRRAAAAALVENEQRWLPTLGALLAVAVPAPVRVGRPSALYPWSWSVVPWLAGQTAAAQPVAARTGWAVELADALTALHVPAAADAPVNPFRGGPVATRGDSVTERIDAGHLDGVVPHARDRARELWADGLTAPRWGAEPVWLHGDPHPANLLQRDGTLAALLDFGDLTAGDPACDLATAWLTFDAAGRAAFRARVDGSRPADPGRWRRAAAWALVLASAFLTHRDDDPTMAAIGSHAVRQLLA